MKTWFQVCKLHTDHVAQSMISPIVIIVQGLSLVQISISYHIQKLRCQQVKVRLLQQEKGILEELKHNLGTAIFKEQIKILQIKTTKTLQARGNKSSRGKFRSCSFYLILIFNDFSSYRFKLPKHMTNSKIRNYDQW